MRKIHAIPWPMVKYTTSLRNHGHYHVGTQKITEKKTKYDNIEDETVNFALSSSRVCVTQYTFSRGKLSIFTIPWNDLG